MPVNSSGMQTSAGAFGEMAAAGVSGHEAGLTASWWPPAPRSVATKATPAITVSDPVQSRTIPDYNQPVPRMTVLSRREFGRVVLVGTPLVGAALTARLSAASPVILGLTTSSFRDLPRVTGRDNVDDLIRAVREAGASNVELALGNVEPAPPNTGSFLGGSAAYPRRVVLTPEEIAATNGAYRAELRTWRLKTPAGFFETAREKFGSAGITVHACALSYEPSFTDDEIDATFKQVKSLGVGTVSVATTMAGAARLAPFAERHRVALAIHNQVDGNSLGLIATPQLKDALALSPAIKLKLDTGNLTASNRDAVAELRANLSRVSHVVLKDRLRNGGTSQPFGEGDTPIAGVLDVLKTAVSPIPALVEYDYLGLRSPVDETRAALAYAGHPTK